MGNIKTNSILRAIAISVALAACSGSGTGGARSGGSLDAGTVVSIAGACNTEYLTAACTCADQNNIAGVETCTSGSWSSCVCVAPDVNTGGTGGGAGTGVTIATDGGQGIVSDPPGDMSANRFSWQQTPFDLGICKAGHYVGEFMGFYGSPAAFGAPVPVIATTGADGSPGLEFWLTRVPGSGEVFAISGGKMRGTADGAFPFTADLTGMLDCATKKYVGTIANGEYMVFGTTYKFVGTMTADYDKVQNKFINGIWHCTEPPSTTVPPGGDGMWDTTWQAK